MGRSMQFLSDIKFSCFILRVYYRLFVFVVVFNRNLFKNERNLNNPTTLIIQNSRSCSFLIYSTYCALIVIIKAKQSFLNHCYFCVIMVLYSCWEVFVWYFGTFLLCLQLAESCWHWKQTILKNGRHSETVEDINQQGGAPNCNDNTDQALQPMVHHFLTVKSPRTSATP